MGTMSLPSRSSQLPSQFGRQEWLKRLISRYLMLAMLGEDRMHSGRNPAHGWKSWKEQSLLHEHPFSWCSFALSAVAVK